MGTLRQRIIELLSQEPLDAVQLAQALGVREKELFDHLPHIARSVGARRGGLRMRPASCRNCGFEFKERRRLSPPGRCPRCGQSRIDGPWYYITGM